MQRLGKAGCVTMAKRESREGVVEVVLEQQPERERAEEPQTPRIPVGLADAAQRIVNFLIRTESKHRLVRVRDVWVLVDVTKVDPVDVGVLGHELGVLDECEVIV